MVQIGKVKTPHSRLRDPCHSGCSLNDGRQRILLGVIGSYVHQRHRQFYAANGLENRYENDDIPGFDCSLFEAPRVQPSRLRTVEGAGILGSSVGLYETFEGIT